MAIYARPRLSPFARNNRRPLRVTAMEVPMSASTASHSATSPNGASRTNRPLMRIETATFCLMIPSAERESRTAQDDRRLDGGLDLGKGLARGAKRDAALIAESRAADEVPLTSDYALGSPAGDGAEVPDFR